MLRATVSALVLALWFSSAAPGQQTFTIKLKKTEAGDTLVLDRRADNVMRMKMTDADGKTVEEQDERDGKSSEEFSYRETVQVKSPDDKKPTKLIREYTKARLTQVGQTRALPYEGKTVLIEKKDDRYHFQIKGGDELTGPAALYFDREFNAAGKDKLEDEHFLPKKPVAVGETWKIDTAPLVKSLNSDSAIEVGATGTTATGKLVRTYQRGGRQFGIIAIHIDLPLRNFKIEAGKVALKKGAKMVFDGTLDLCIDGTTEDGEWNMTIKSDSTGTFTGPDGKTYTLTLDINAEQKETRQPGGK